MIVNIANVRKAYPTAAGDIEILANVNLTLPKGKNIAILGQSGSGKSTFLSLLAGLDSPSSGTIQVCNENLGTLSEDKLARFRAQHMGIVFQNFHLLHNLTALENVSLALEILGRKNATEVATEALERVGLGSRKDHLPSRLSGGENQRVAIARAFVAKPEIILADEPSGNLDEKTGQEVMQYLFRLIRENASTLILVTHNRELAKRCDAIFELKNKTLEEIH